MENKNVDYVLPVVKDEENKKKVNVKLLIAISSAVLVVLVIGALFLFAPRVMMPKSALKGTWEMTVNPDRISDENTELKESDRTYYEFTKVDKDGKGLWKSFSNGCVEEGEFVVFKKNGKRYINLGGDDLEYTIEGNSNFKKAKLTLVYPGFSDPSTGQVVAPSTYVLEQAANPEYDKKTYENYSVSSELIGDWKTNERGLVYFTDSIPYNQTVTFKENGIMNIRYETEGLNILSYYAYTVKDNKLTFSLVTDRETKYTIEYSFDESGNLKFNDTTTTQSPMFGDAFFGDYTYYRPQNLPQRTEEVTESPTVE